MEGYSDKEIAIRLYNARHGFYDPIKRWEDGLTELSKDAKQ